MTEDMEIPGAIEGIRHLIERLGSENVFIVLKAGHKMRQHIVQWLCHEGQIPQRTGFLMQNLILTYEKDYDDVGY